MWWKFNVYQEKPRDGGWERRIWLTVTFHMEIAPAARWFLEIPLSLSHFPSHFLFSPPSPPFPRSPPPPECPAVAPWPVRPPAWSSLSPGGDCRGPGSVWRWEVAPPHTWSLAGSWRVWSGLRSLHRTPSRQTRARPATPRPRTQWGRTPTQSSASPPPPGRSPRQPAGQTQLR